MITAKQTNDNSQNTAHSRTFISQPSSPTLFSLLCQPLRSPWRPAVYLCRPENDRPVDAAHSPIVVCRYTLSLDLYAVLYKTLLSSHFYLDRQTDSINPPRLCGGIYITVFSLQIQFPDVVESIAFGWNGKRVLERARERRGVYYSRVHSTQIEH